MIWKRYFLGVILLLPVLLIGCLLYPDEKTTLAPVANHLTETAIIEDLKHSMMQLMENNRKLEQEFGSINANLKWYQDYINPVINEHGNALSTTAAVTSFIPGLKDISATVKLFTELARNISYYSNLVGTAKRENSNLHQGIQQFMAYQDKQKLSLIKQEIKLYKVQTEKALAQLEQILPTLSLVQEFNAQSKAYSDSISQSINSLLSNNTQTIPQPPAAVASDDSFEQQINSVHQKMNRVNGLLKNSYDLADEVRMYIFILEKYYPPI